MSPEVPGAIQGPHLLRLGSAFARGMKEESNAGTVDPPAGQGAELSISLHRSVGLIVALLAASG